MHDNCSTGLRLLLWTLPGAHSSFPHCLTLIPHSTLLPWVRLRWRESLRRPTIPTSIDHTLPDVTGLSMLSPLLLFACCLARQVPRILNPVVAVLEELPKLTHDPALKVAAEGPGERPPVPCLSPNPCLGPTCTSYVPS
jgi:hypothetical protein